MTGRRIALVCILMASIAGAGWFGWHWRTTPEVPRLPLERMEKRVAEVIRDALDEVRQAPRSGAAWGKLAMVTAVNGYSEAASDCLINAERFDPTNARWPYLRGHMLMFVQPHQAFPFFHRALACADARDFGPAIRFRLAMALLEDGQLDEAERHLHELGAAEPNSPRLRFALGLLAVARNDRATARDHLATLTSSPFARKRANGQLAALALADGDATLASIYQQRAADFPADIPWPDPILDEMNPYAVGRQSRFLESESLEAQGRPHDALALLRQIVAQTPDARSYLALGLMLAKVQEYDEAEQVIRSVLRRDAQNMQAHHFLATVQFYQGEACIAAPGSKERALQLYREAVAEEDRALALKGDNGMAHLTRGRALQRLGRTDEALQALREAVLCRPEFSDTHLYLGEALAEAGDPRAALPHLENAVRFAAAGDNRPRAVLEKWRARLASP